MPKSILATTSSFGDCAPHLLETIKKQGYEFSSNPFGRKLTTEELEVLLSKFKPIGLLAGTEPITASILRNARDYLTVISRVGVGWDNIDRQTAQELGIQVFRTKGVLNQAVAELTIGMILYALRAIPFQDRQVCGGIWQKEMGQLLEDKVVGVIGFGAIGQRVGELVTTFGARVVYYDPVQTDRPWAKPVTLHELLTQADIVTIHASGQDQILGKREFNSLCKPGVIVVNTSRGGLVDEEALYKALVSGRVAYACMDVFDQEPYCGPLTKVENAILTPHIGSYALEARIRMEEMAVENLMTGLHTLTE